MIPCCAFAAQEPVQAREKVCTPSHDASWGKPTAHEAVRRLESGRAREKGDASWGKERVREKACTP
jgi:hypothetical protein